MPLHTKKEALLKFRKENIRLKSFINWKGVGPQPNFLAKAGFFYYQQDSETQCVFCLGIVKSWGADDDPFLIHQTKFPNCPFICGLSDNIPLTRLSGVLIFYFLSFFGQILGVLVFEKILSFFFRFGNGVKPADQRKSFH